MDEEPSLEPIRDDMVFEHMTQDLLEALTHVLPAADSSNGGPKQGYCVVPSAQKFIVLYSLLKRILSKKVMVFFSSCSSVKFHSELLRYFQVDCVDIHGKQKQQKRTTTFFDFMKAEKGILLCTDITARGLDIPAVDWIVQYDPPNDLKEYIHRIGRTTARGEGGKGNAVLFLNPKEELLFERYLKEAKFPVKKFKYVQRRLSNVQSELEKLVATNYNLNKLAKDAYRSYILAYNSHSLKEIFNVDHLNLQDVATSFCFSNPPKVKLNIDSGASKLRKKTRKVERQFTRHNPYGKQGSGGDPKRQFTRHNPYESSEVEMLNDNIVQGITLMERSEVEKEMLHDILQGLSNGTVCAFANAL